ncbi:hypothetical protein L1D14_07745 [Vibrio tubiashii]|uniref:hypothetical protein n=1 Tax=Vibrio tubiashii TaxID=29498 RepID=UPI001EFD2306|nr:hypothetical protein [Vibrio tubiashii]MCG9576132.1 hypothetical protein [Vibrio tubiashii]
MTDELQFKWVFNPPKLKQVKQPDTISLDDFDSLIHRLDNEGVDPLIASRNQAMLWSTLGSGFRAIEVSSWTIKEALYPNGELMKLTRIAASGTKGTKSILAPVIIDKERYYINRWLDLRVKHRIGMNFTGKNQELYRGLNPNSRVFMSFHHGEWKPFAMQTKVVAGKEYSVCTSLQNTIKKLYKDYGHAGCSSHTGRHTLARLASKILSNKHSDSELREIIKNLLHHRDIRSQEEYTDINWDDLRLKSKEMFK